MGTLVGIATAARFVGVVCGCWAVAALWTCFVFYLLWWFAWEGVLVFTLLMFWCGCCDHDFGPFLCDISCVLWVVCSGVVVVARVF